MSWSSNFEPLIIVPDDDDDDDIECLDITEIPTTSNENNQRTVQTRSRPKKLSCGSLNRQISFRSNISCVTFDQVDDVLTISRSGLTFYCIEDIYSKIFESLCTYEKFLNYLTKQDHLIIKQATLLEKFALDEHNSQLRKYNPVRYRLVSIRASDYLIRLKQFLLERQLDDAFQRFKNFISTNRLCSDFDDNSSMPTIVNIEENVQMNPKPSPNPLRQLLTEPYSPSVSFSEAIFENKHLSLEDLPKLVVRHQKVFSTRTIDTLGELFPGWFVYPTYRCIHCFTCDQVFTPRSFMLHVDDKQITNDKPLKISSIELLTSERISTQKVDLWNEFCSNLKVHAKEGQDDGFKDFLVD